MTPQNTPLEISDEATTTVAKIGSLCYSPDLPHRFHDNAEKLVQLAINSATAKLREENEKIKKSFQQGQDARQQWLQELDKLKAAEKERDQLKLRVEELGKENSELRLSECSAYNAQNTALEDKESLQKQIVGLREACQEFVHRCEIGEVRSTKSQAKFRTVLEATTNFSHLYVRREALEKCRAALQEFLDYSNGGCNPNLEDVYREQASEALTLARKELGE